MIEVVSSETFCQVKHSKRPMTRKPHHSLPLQGPCTPHVFPKLAWKTLRDERERERRGGDGTQKVEVVFIYEWRCFLNYVEGFSLLSLREMCKWLRFTFLWRDPLREQVLLNVRGAWTLADSPKSQLLLCIVPGIHNAVCLFNWRFCIEDVNLWFVEGTRFFFCCRNERWR